MGVRFSTTEQSPQETWSHGTMVIIVPLPDGVAMDGDPGQWTLTGLNPINAAHKPKRQGYRGQQRERQADESLHLRFAGSHLNETAQAWHDDRPPVLDELAHRGLTLLAIETRTFSPVEPTEPVDSYAMVHFALSAHALMRPDRVVLEAHRPTFVAGDERDLNLVVADVLALTGIAVTIGTGGFVAMPDGRIGDLFTLSHVVSDGDLPGTGAITGTHETWDADDMWTFVLSTPTHARTRRPSADEREAGRLSLEDRCEARVCATGISIIGWDAAEAEGDNGPLSELHTRMRGRLHTSYADVAMLCMRQRRALWEHEEHLLEQSKELVASVDAETPAEASAMLRDKLQRVADLERRLLALRSELWTTHDNLHDDSTRLLREMQARLGLDRLLEELIQQQNDSARIVQLQVSVAEEKARDEERNARTLIERERQTREHERQEKEARDRRLTGLFGLVAVVAIVPTLVLAAATLFDQPSATLFWWGLGVSLVLAVVVIAVGWFVLKRMRLVGSGADRQ